MFDLSSSMSEAFAASAPMTYRSSSDNAADEKFAYLSDMDYSLVDSFFMYFASDGNNNADEIAVIAVKDAKDAAFAEESLKTHLEKRISLYSTYDPSQLEKLNSGIVFSSGIYAVLIVGDNAESAKAAFYGFIG